MSTMSKLVNESLNENIAFGKMGRLKSYLSKRMDELEITLARDESNQIADARLEELVYIMDMMDWDLMPAK